MEPQEQPFDSELITPDADAEPVFALTFLLEPPFTHSPGGVTPIIASAIFLPVTAMGWGKTRQRATLLALALVGPALTGVLLGGCGGSADVVTVTEESTTVVQVQEPSDPAMSDAARAEQTVRSYYKEINNYSYRKAWRLLSPTLQEELGGFAIWRDGYGTTVETTPSGVKAVEASASSALVSLELRSTDLDECGDRIEQTFTGTWSLEGEGRYLATGFDIEKTGGGTPVFDPSECPYEAGPEASSSGGSGCDLNYTGCVPISAYDVDCDEVGEEVEVIGEDVYGLDLEEDGYACESY